MGFADQSLWEQVMGHSIQVVGERVVIVDDEDLLVVLLFLIERATAQEEVYSALQTFVEEWKQQITGYGPGVLDLAVDRIADQPMARAELEQMMREVGKEIADRFGETIPASTLNHFKKPFGV
jgi:hypothetical protein